MSKKRVFFLTSDGLSVYQWRYRKVLEPLVFTADEAGLTQFSRYLDQAPQLPAYLLVDLVDEEFRPETIPHVFGSDRRALLRNRRVRLFRDARFANSIFLCCVVFGSSRVVGMIRSYLQRCRGPVSSLRG